VVEVVVVVVVVVFAAAVALPIGIMGSIYDAAYLYCTLFFDER